MTTDSQGEFIWHKILLLKPFVKIFLPFWSRSRLNFLSPGRINLIGEHTDYNGGRVFPAAISLGTYGAARKRDDQVFAFLLSQLWGQGIIMPLADLSLKKTTGPTIKGFFISKKLAMSLTKGLIFMFIGNIPNSGLSSSASLELLTGVVAGISLV